MARMRLVRLIAGQADAEQLQRSAAAVLLSAAAVFSSSSSQRCCVELEQTTQALRHVVDLLVVTIMGRQSQN